jgi:hypothetical protein
MNLANDSGHPCAIFVPGAHLGLRVALGDPAHAGVAEVADAVVDDDAARQPL